MSVLADFQVNAANPAVVVTAAANITINYFPRPSGSLVTPRSATFSNNGPLPGPTTPNATNASGQLAYPGNSELNGQLARVQLAGNISTIISTNVTVTLQANTGTVSNPNYVNIATSGLFNSPGNGGNPQLPPVAVPWSIEVVCSGDSASGILQGQYSGMANGAYHNTNNSNPWVLLDNNLSGINFTPGAAPFGLVAAVTFATGNIANSAKLTQFQIIGG